MVARLESVRRHAGRLTELINDLLDVSRLSIGAPLLVRSELQLATVVRRVVASFREQAKRAGSELFVQVDEDVTGSWDGARLEQVLASLVANALKFGAGRPIRVTVGRGGAGARVTVRDHGIGIERDAQQRIFGKFVRAVSAQHYGGFGLGLFIARQLVEAHGGTLAVESSPGEGAVFTVELPVRCR